MTVPDLQPEAIALANSANGLVTAPAGCGKTQLVTEAVLHAHLSGQRRQLVLTHTHAGVDALRARLARTPAPSASYQVETIDGWALRFATAFPRRCNIQVPHDHADFWRAVHESVASLLATPAIREVIAASYGGVVVDEYQDCTTAQHDLVLALGRVTPIRVLGDPLQGIFEFAGAVDWETHVTSSFSEVGPLGTPWRWHGKNTSLGQWLIDQRPAFLGANSIDLSASPIGVRSPSATSDMTQETWSACNALRRRDGTSLVISKWARSYVSVAKNFQGSFSVIEPIDSADLTRHAKALARCTGTALVMATLDFAKACATGVSDAVGAAAVNKFKAGDVPNAANYRTKREIVGLLVDVANSSTNQSVHRALSAIKRAPETKVYRRELLDEFMRALTVGDTGAIEEEPLLEAMTAVRNLTRHTGRRLPSRAFGSPLLVKGLEFDHVVVLKPEEMTRRELYVALSRATRTVSVVANGPILTLRD